METLEPKLTEQEIVEQAKAAANPTPGKPGRPAVRQRRKYIAHQLRTGQAQSVDKSWLLEQLLKLYSGKEVKPQEKLRALELMARISGYQGQEEPADERKAIQDLLADMPAQSLVFNTSSETEVT